VSIWVLIPSLVLALAACSRPKGPPIVPSDSPAIAAKEKPALPEPPPVIETPDAGSTAGLKHEVDRLGGLVARTAQNDGITRRLVMAAKGFERAAALSRTRAIGIAAVSPVAESLPEGVALLGLTVQNTAWQLHVKGQKEPVEALGSQLRSAGMRGVREQIISDQDIEDWAIHFAIARNAGRRPGGPPPIPPPALTPDAKKALEVKVQGLSQKASVPKVVTGRTARIAAEERLAKLRRQYVVPGDADLTVMGCADAAGLQVTQLGDATPFRWQGLITSRMALSAAGSLSSLGATVTCLDRAGLLVGDFKAAHDNTAHDNTAHDKAGWTVVLDILIAR